MSDLMKLTDLPPGSVQLPRTGRPLNGWELASGLENLVAREVGWDVVSILRDTLANQWWNREHLQFPRARIEWLAAPDGMWLRAGLMNGKEFTWSWGAWPVDGEPRVVGPCDRPDDLREALGLPVVVKFRQPDKAIVSVRVDEGMAEYKPQGVRVVREEVLRPDSGAEPVVVTIETPMEELVAEPPKVPLLATKPVSAPPGGKPVGVVLKGARK